MNSIWRTAILCCLGALLAATIACSGDDNDDVGGAESQLCSDLQDLSLAVQKVDALTPASTVDQARDARTEVEKAMEEVRKSSKNVSEARVENLDKAYSDFQNSFQNVSGSQTIGSVAADVKVQSANVTLARQQLGQQVRCPAA